MARCVLTAVWAARVLIVLTLLPAALNENLLGAPAWNMGKCRPSTWQRRASNGILGSRACRTCEKHEARLQPRGRSAPLPPHTGGSLEPRSGGVIVSGTPRLVSLDRAPAPDGLRCRRRRQVVANPGTNVARSLLVTEAVLSTDPRQTGDVRDLICLPAPASTP